MTGFPILPLRNVLLSTIGILSILIFLLSGHEVVVQWQQLENVKSLQAASYIGDDLLGLADKLSVERHTSYSILSAPDQKTVDDLRPQLEDSRKKSDAAFQAVLPRLNKNNLADLQPKIRAIEDKMRLLHELRPQIDKNILLPDPKRNDALSARWFDESTDVIVQIQNLWMAFITHFIEVDPIVNVHMRLKYFLLVAMENTGREHSIIGRLIVRNVRITPQEQGELLRWHGAVDLCWTAIQMLADQGMLVPKLTPYLKDAESDYSNVDNMMRDIFYMPGAHVKMPYPISPELWIELTKQANDSLYALKLEALKETQAYVADLGTKASHRIVFYLMVLLFSILLCWYCLRIVLRRVLAPIRIMADALVDATRGKAISPALGEIGQNDEIGKLAEVLAIFQKRFDELKRSNMELDNFAYIASHDLKEPMRGLSHQAAFLMEDYKDKLDPEGVQRLKSLVYLSQRMNQFIHDLLYFSQLGRTELAIQRTDLNAVISDTRVLLKDFLSDHNARIMVPQPLPAIVCDKIKIAEVFRNLITNAVKYNNKTEKIVEIGAIRTKAAPHRPENYTFYVRDNGIGIAPKFHDVIFRIFKRLQDPSIKDEEGTGSGLTFVKKIVERHHGRVWLESAPGEGTTFYFTLGDGGDTI